MNELNGIIYNGEVHRLVIDETGNPCAKCSLKKQCMRCDTQCYPCEMFGVGPYKRTFKLFGVLAEVRRVETQIPSLN